MQISNEKTIFTNCQKSRPLTTTGIPNQVLKAATTVANQWEELTFDFGALGTIPAGTEFKQLVFRYNDSADGVGEVIYIDNVRQTN